MARRVPGFGKPRWKRTKPREIRASAAAPKPSQQTPDTVFADDSEPTTGWQSDRNADVGAFSFARKCLVRSAAPLELGGG